jgi:hypothetical protein
VAGEGEREKDSKKNPPIEIHRKCSLSIVLEMCVALFSGLFPEKILPGLKNSALWK